MLSRVAKTSKPCWVRRVLWSFLLLVLATFGTLVVLGHFYWEAGLERQRALEADLRNSGGLREPLFGVSEPGDAYGEYRDVLAELRRQSDDTAHLISTHVDRPFESPPELTPKVRESLAAQEPLLQRLRSASRCESCTIPDDAFARDVWPRAYDWFAIHRAVDLLSVSARARMQDGDLNGAVAEIATALQLTLDASRAPDGFISNLIALRVLEPLKSLLGQDLDLATIRAVEVMLTRLETDWPGPMSVLDAFEADVTRALMEDVERNGWMRRIGGGWLPHTLYNARCRADGVLREVQRKTWNHASDRYTDCYVRTRASWIPFDAVWTEQARSADHMNRMLLAQLRLIRAGARLRLGKGPEVAGWPLDPFTLQPVSCRIFDGHAHMRVTRGICWGPDQTICIPTR
jgi:hypothetical protein